MARRNRLLDTLRLYRGSILLELLEAIQEEEPSYTRFESMHDHHRWTETVAWMFDLFLQIAEHDRALTTSEQRAIRQIGTERRLQAFDVGAARAAVRAAVGVLRTRILAEYDQQRDDRTDVDRLFTVIDQFRHTVEDALHGGFAENNERNVADAPTTLLQDIVDRKVRSHDDVTRRASEIGCDDKRSILVITADRQAAGALSSSIKDALVAHHAGPLVPHSVFVVPSSSAHSHDPRHLDRLANEYSTTLLVCGPSTPVGLYDRYVCALPLVPHLRYVAADEPVLVDSDIYLALIAAALPHDIRGALVRRVLGNLSTRAPRQAKKLLDLLDSHLRGGFSATAVQRDLKVNIKTVYGQRHKFEERTGFSLSDPAHRAILAIARYAMLLGDGQRETRLP